MKLSTRGGVVKSQDVTLAVPRLVDCDEGFQRLEEYLTVLMVEPQALAQNASEQADGFPEETKLEEPGKLGASDPEAVIRQAQEKAQAIIDEARAAAGQILAGAEADARRIVEAAQTEAERLSRESKRTAEEEIYPAAKQEGYKAGREVAEAEGKVLKDNAAQILRLAERAVQDEYAKVDLDLLHLALKVAERLVRSSLAFNPRQLRSIIRSLTLLPQEREGWLLHISPEDEHLFRDESLFKNDQLPCQWLADESLRSGDCFLECQEGLFDARLETQLDKLETILREELEHGSLGSIGSGSRTA